MKRTPVWIAPTRISFTESAFIGNIGAGALVVGPLVGAVGPLVGAVVMA